MESWAAWAQSPNLRPTCPWLGLTWVEELTELKGATGQREGGPSSDGRNGEGWMLVSWTEVDTRAGSCVPPQPITAQLCSHLAVSTNHSAALLSSLFTAESPPPAQARLVTPPWQETCALLKYEPSGHLVLWSHKQRFIYKQ